MAKRGSDAGFTLLELLIVIAVLSLAATVGAAWLPDVGERLAVARSASQLEQMLARLAADALHTGLDQTAVVANTGAKQAIKAGGSLHRFDAGTTVSWIAAAEAGSDGDRGTIVFFGTGGATGGKLELVRGSARVAVEIDWLTARVQSNW
jgi:general secretion pathway protein H